MICVGRFGMTFFLSGRWCGEGTTPISRYEVLGEGGVIASL